MLRQEYDYLTEEELDRLEAWAHEFPHALQPDTILKLVAGCREAMRLQEQVANLALT